MNIATMSLKQWYTVLLEDKVIKCQTDPDSPPSLIPVQPEVLSPDTDWNQVWPTSRTKGLGPELSSFLFKMLHRLLPTQERIARLGIAGEERGF